MSFDNRLTPRFKAHGVKGFHDQGASGSIYGAGLSRVADVNRLPSLPFLAEMFLGQQDDSSWLDL